MTDTVSKIVRACALSLGLLCAPAGHAGPTVTMLEDAIEARSVELSTDLMGRTTAIVRSCRNCEPVKLAVTATTQAFEDGRPVPLEQAAHLTNTDVTVFFLIKDRTVSRITW